MRTTRRPPGESRCRLFLLGPWGNSADRRGGQLHRDAEPASGPGGEGEGSVVCLGDAFDDCQAEADTRVVGAYAFGAALKRLAKRGNQLWGELLAGVLDSEHHSFGVNARCDPDR